ncbi:MULTISPECIES: PilZ domain-containing protein [Novosphingobium]|uniref:PilZ domain-containing protein n=1 Tax=Novosphingobium decolorationis TaxID=2698673 RepID=A0ABX8E9Q9_9SPHN|nr:MULTISPECIES: PilZ domain-containing protein [Novosphingobium]MED5547153.1 PilZ domain-containing protein [Pseudomonadota bacterium]QVM85854.1 PilZ domain-containing protein [Novosphingobium decolorationis]GAM07193.1 pilus protein PilZ [Novosphingobium sp. MBES04]
MASTGKQLYENAAQEDRSAPRERISIPASLRASGGKGYQTVVRDLSMSGFSATAMSRIHPGTYCWLTLPGMESMAAKVIWWDEGMVGCAFENLIAPIIYEDLMVRWRLKGWLGKSEG